MRLSAAMRAALLYIRRVYSRPNCRCGRPFHYENLKTHEALLRRGLIQEADDNFRTTTLTPAGEAVVERLLGSP